MEVKLLSVFLPLLSLYEGIELMMACRYFSCSRLVESAWEGTAGKKTHEQTFIIQVTNTIFSCRYNFIGIGAVKVCSSFSIFF